MFDTSPRVPPHNLEAEQALLGSILLSNRAFEKVAEFLRPEHFADPVHGRIFTACGKLIERGQMANPVTLKTSFEQDGGLTEIGGTAYLAQLANSVVSVVNAGDYGRLILDLHQRRELIGLGEDLVNRAFEADLDTSAESLIEEAEALLSGLAENGEVGGGSRAFSEIMPTMVKEAAAARERGGGGIGLATGLADLDERLGGLAPGNLVVLGARPAMGKSALGFGIARHVADQVAVGGSHVYPSVSRVMRDCGVSERHVQNAIRRQVEAGILTLVRPGGGRHRPSEYRFNLETLKGCIPCGVSNDETPHPVRGIQGLNPAPGAPFQAETPHLTTRNPAPGAPNPSLPTNKENLDHREVKAEPLLLINDAPSTSAEHLFEEWWALVPKKVSKGQAKKAFKAALRKAGSFEVLAEGIRRYAASVQGKDTQYIAHPTTWLKGERWADDLPGSSAGLATSDFDREWAAAQAKGSEAIDDFLAKHRGGAAPGRAAE